MGREYVMRVRRFPPDLWLAAMDVAIGLIHLLSAPSRSSAPAFAVARSLAHYVAPWLANPMQLWGVVFIALGIALAAAVLRLHRGGSRSAATWWVQSLGPALFMMWALMYLLAGRDDRASLLGIPPYLYLAWRHYYAPAAPVG